MTKTTNLSTHHRSSSCPEGSPSPIMIKLEDCVQELLKFVLQSSTNGTLDFDLGLSTAFCSVLLKHDPSTSNPLPDSKAGVPPYPLYERLTLALWESLCSGTFCPMYEKMSMKNGESSLKQKEEIWLKLIMDKGSEMVQYLIRSNFSCVKRLLFQQMLKTINLDLYIDEPFFTQLKDGQKTIEGKYALGKYDRLEPGMLIIFNKCLLFEILDIRRYVSFSDMLESENLQSILPGIESINEGLQILKSLNREEEEMGDSVLALCISRVPFQPYISLAAIISGLSYEGLQGLLGLAHTAGTVADVLPPPRSALLSSFVLPYKPKNRLAMNTIVHLIAHCCWMNIHIVAPHGIVFEIRIAQGYGARWSKDGNKVSFSYKTLFLCNKFWSY
uniref:ASCH domain-containing protein n=1 Tax=Cucumis melo TaxID=3656 RepID=A0A9I9DRA0_CUCME